MFDSPEKKPVVHPANNFLLFDQVDIKDGNIASDTQSNNSRPTHNLRASVTAPIGDADAPGTTKQVEMK